MYLYTQRYVASVVVLKMASAASRSMRFGTRPLGDAWRLPAVLFGV